MIGGRDDGPESETTVVGEYRDGTWNNLGHIAKKRGYHSAIKSGSDVMIIGGVERGANPPM